MNTTDQTRIQSNDNSKKVLVPIKGRFANWIKENRGKGGLAVGFLSGLAFVSASKINSTSLLAGDTSPMEGGADDIVPEKSGDPYISIDPGDSIGMVSNKSTFSDAFHDARSELGAGGIFEWNGTYYNTYLKEEWEAMSAENKIAYSQKVNDLIDSENSNIVEPGSGIVTEYTDSKILKITIDNPDLIGEVSIIQLDVTNDGNPDLVLKVDSFIKEPSSNEEILDKPETVIDMGGSNLDSNSNSNAGTINDPITMDSLSPEKSSDIYGTEDSNLDQFFDGFPDIDEFDNEFSFGL
ncbi:MAG: hypothetical protein EA412_03655 [Chitinophagaceae bacterium]|nr:MAG: hypothetical protein EA412_03655 [Chitinophagaceae bacterium]